MNYKALMSRICDFVRNVGSMYLPLEQRS